MSLFPERPQDHSLTSRSGQELAIIAPGLTAAQISQLTMVTQSYMRKAGLVGYDNSRAVLPVIRECVVDGLMQLHQRDRVSPADNLAKAFKIGYGQRKALIADIAAQLPGEDDNGVRFTGALALSRPLVQAASDELAKRAVTPTFDSGKRILEMALVRRPVFQQLVSFCRAQVEQIIPGSSQVALTPAQETGLVRNMVFSWVASNQPNPLLETEDFMAGRGEFADILAKSDKIILLNLLRNAGIETNNASIRYVDDLASQVNDFLVSTPAPPAPGSDELTIIGVIDTAFKSLDGRFLVINPFQRLEPLSGNPQDQGRSIWDPNRSILISIDGKSYRFPTAYTLRLASYLAGGTTIALGKKYRQAAELAEDLQKEWLRQQARRQIPDLEQQLTQRQQTVNIITADVSEGRVPRLWAFTKAEVEQMVNQQFRLMAEEESFFPAIKRSQAELFQLGIAMLQTYKEGLPLLDQLDAANLRRLRYGPAMIRREVMYFLRDRIKGRIHNLTAMTDNLTFVKAMAKKVDDRDSEDTYAEALNTNVLDALRLRGEFWRTNYLGQPKLTPEKERVVWIGILKQEKDHLYRELREHFYIPNRFLTPENIKAVEQRILANPYHPYFRKLMDFQQLEGRVTQGRPGDHQLFDKYLQHWISQANQAFNRAIYSWSQSQEPLKSVLADDTAIEDINPDIVIRNEQESSFQQLSHRSFGPAAIILLSLVKLSPPGLRPTYEANLFNLVTNYFKDGDDLFRFISSDDRKARAQRLSPILRLFQDWVIDSELGVDYAGIADSLHQTDMNELIISGNYYHRLFAMEPKISQWFSYQRQSLEQQLAAQASFFKVDPGIELKKQQEQIRQTSTKLKIMRHDAVVRLKSRAERLQQLGLIMPVDNV